MRLMMCKTNYSFQRRNHKDTLPALYMKSYCYPEKQNEKEDPHKENNTVPEEKNIHKRA